MGRRAPYGCGPICGRHRSGQGARGVQWWGARGRPSWWAPDPASQTCLPIFGEWCSPGRRAKCATAALTPAARLTSSFPVSARGTATHPSLLAARARRGRCRQPNYFRRLERFQIGGAVLRGRKTSIAGSCRQPAGDTGAEQCWPRRLRSRRSGVFPGGRSGGTGCPVLQAWPGGRGVALEQREK